MCVVGDGTRIRFWLDPWVGELPLHVMFPRIFALTIDRTVCVSDVGSFTQGKWIWNIAFRRPCFDWEVDIQQEFMATINAMVPGAGRDGLVWMGDASGKFSVRVLCFDTEMRVFGAPTWSVPKLVRTIAPPKVALFVWQASLDRIAFLANLMRREVVIERDGSCCICGGTEETVDHLLLCCGVSWRLWCGIF